MDLNISNIINISVSQSGTGVSAYNTSNVALFSRDTAGGGFGSDGYKIYLSPTEVGVDFGTSSATFLMANALFSQQPNILGNRGYLVVIPFEDGTETVGEAVTRTSDLVQYFGIMAAELVDETDGLAAAAIVQPLNKILAVVSRTAADVEPAGYLDLLATGSLKKTRGLFYGSDNDNDALVFLASYVGRGFSTNFNGSNTTQTMNMKDLTGVQADPSMTQTLFAKCKDAGADVYASFGGTAKVYSSGANDFFDDVYNEAWFVGAIEVAGFNTLAQVGNKIAQTEEGVDILKGSYRKICEQGLINQYMAPGTWNSPTTFGIQEDFFNNIIERGYYIYSEPVATQLPTAREAREAPLIQIAIKLAGAIHSSAVIININK